MKECSKFARVCFNLCMNVNSELLIPSEKGNYLLTFQVEQSFACQIGKLGVAQFSAGTYHYSGSAQGGGGIAARVKYHLKHHAHPHWHLDFLRPYIRFTACHWLISPPGWECRWMQCLQNEPNVHVPLPRFGASDCQTGCKAHLFQLERTPVQIKILLEKISPPEFMYNWVEICTCEA